MKEKAEFVDKYLRKTDGIKARPGFNSFDELKTQPSPSLLRSFEAVKDQEEKDFPKYENHFMAQGAAIGLDQAGKIVHYYAGRGIRFAGFLIHQTLNKAVIKSRGSAFLKLEGVSPEDRGQRVFCSAPNQFSLKPSSNDDAEIGKIRFMERANFAAVAFKGENDSRPLNLKVK